MLNQYHRHHRDRPRRHVSGRRVSVATSLAVVEESPVRY